MFFCIYILVMQSNKVYTLVFTPFQICKISSLMSRKIYVYMSKSKMSSSDVPPKVTSILGAQRAVGAGEGRNPSVGPHVNIKRPSVII